LTRGNFGDVRSSRVISPGLRAGLLVGVGTALLAVPFAIGLSLAAVVTGVVVGVLAIGLGLAGTAPDGRGTIPISAHAVYDSGLAAGLVFTAVAFAVYGETTAAIFFFATGLVQLLLSATTRYTGGRVAPNFLQ
jgi:hypothetical protein